MQAYSGGMSVTGELGGPPVKMGISVADIGAGLFAAVGILSALEARRATGQGQHVTTSLLGGQLAMLSYHLTSFFASGRVPHGQGSGTGFGVPYQAFQGADDWFIVAVFNEAMWQSLCRALERPDWVDDPHFADLEARVAASRRGAGSALRHLLYQDRAALGGTAQAARRTVHPDQPYRPDRRGRAGGERRHAHRDAVPGTGHIADGRPAGEVRHVGAAGVVLPSAARRAHARHPSASSEFQPTRSTAFSGAGVIGCTAAERPTFGRVKPLPSANRDHKLVNAVKLLGWHTPIVAGRSGADKANPDHQHRD